MTMVNAGLKGLIKKGGLLQLKFGVVSFGVSVTFSSCLVVGTIT